VKLKFEFEKERDLWNIWETCRKRDSWCDFSRGMPKEVVKFCRGKTFRYAKPKILNYYKKIYESGFISVYLNSVEKFWNLVEVDFYRRLEKITRKKFKKKRSVVYLTLATRCPYDYNKEDNKSWFMICFWSNLSNAILTIAHELMHFHFFDNYVDKIVDEIGEKKMEDLKESLTVLLNLEFGDLFFSFDRGYDLHRNLRKFIVRQWNRKKDFDLLLSKCVEYLKKNG
jgi:hypothetical protein